MPKEFDVAPKAETVIPVLAEELEIRTVPVVTGGVRVHRRVVEHEEELDIPIVREHVDVRRVIFDREVQGPLPVRQEGDTTIIPVVEEQLIITKRYLLKEEIHVTRTAHEERHQERVVVCRQEAHIEEIERQSDV